MKESIIRITVMVLFFLIFIIPIYNKGKQYGKKLYNQSNGIKK